MCILDSRLLSYLHLQLTINRKTKTKTKRKNTNARRKYTSTLVWLPIQWCRIRKTRNRYFDRWIFILRDRTSCETSSPVSSINFKQRIGARFIQHKHWLLVKNRITVLRRITMLGRLFCFDYLFFHCSSTLLFSVHFRKPLTVFKMLLLLLVFCITFTLTLDLKIYIFCANFPFLLPSVLQCGYVNRSIGWVRQNQRLNLHSTFWDILGIRHCGI